MLMNYWKNRIALLGLTLATGLLPDCASAQQPPAVGAFYSMQLTNLPPYPFNPYPELQLYQIGQNRFAYDDRSVDYSTSGTWAAQSFAGGGGQMLTSSEPPPSPCPECEPCTNCPPAGFTNPPPYSVPGLKVTIPVITNDVVYLSIFEHDPALPYDIYFKSDLNQANWAWAASGIVAQTNFFLASFSMTYTNQAFFVAGSAADLDADGIKDGEEAWVWRTNPFVADTDNDGLSDGYELFVSFTDPFSAGPVPTLGNRSISKCPVP
jgi:hypothetical protein